MSHEKRRRGMQPGKRSNVWQHTDDHHFSRDFNVVFRRQNLQDSQESDCSDCRVHPRKAAALGDISTYSSSQVSPSANGRASAYTLPLRINFSYERERQKIENDCHVKDLMLALGKLQLNVPGTAVSCLPPDRHKASCTGKPQIPHTRHVEFQNLTKIQQPCVLFKIETSVEMMHRIRKNRDVSTSTDS
eukprot:757680-Hanusia_phi.AAC.2